jgi:hypothetical protein
MFVGGVIMAALLAVAMPVASASAAKKLLVLSNAGTPAPTGAPAKLGVSLAGCGIYAGGTITVNDATKDKLVAGAGTPVSECFEGLSSAGGLTEMQWGVTGKATMKGKISISKPGPCTYLFTKWKGEFAVPGAAYIEAVTTGKLNKKVSSKSCPATDSEEFAASAVTPENGIFEDELGS